MAGRKNIHGQSAQAAEQSERFDNATVPEQKAGIAVRGKWDGLRQKLDKKAVKVNMPQGITSVRLIAPDPEKPDFQPVDLVEAGWKKRLDGTEYYEDEHLVLTFEIWGTDWTITKKWFYLDNETRTDKKTGQKLKSRNASFVDGVNNASSGRTRRITDPVGLIDWLSENWIPVYITEVYNEEQRRYYNALSFYLPKDAEESGSTRLDA